MPINDVNPLENMVQLYYGKLSRLQVDREVLYKIFESPERLVIDIQKVKNDYSLTIYTLNKISKNPFFQNRYTKQK